MTTARINVMSIAGFDPSGGAGVLSDIKTFEGNETYGFGVITSNTFQNDIEFDSVEWVATDEIIKQIKVIFNRFKPDCIKIGLVKDLEALEAIIDELVSLNSDVKIIWDPILKATAGFKFHDEINKEILDKILKKIYLITPNLNETDILFNTTDVDELKNLISQKGICNVLIKGGHSLDNTSIDYLVEKDNISSIDGKQMPEYAKHGTGCVLSAAITANLGKGKSLVNSCLHAKEYIVRFMKSNKTKLGYHKI